MATKFKRNEDRVLLEAINYIEKTYNEHYVTDGGDLQTIDVWESLGSLKTTARDTAVKYLMRYGKKNGHNAKDLYKAIHYIVLMIYEGQKLSAKQSLRDFSERDRINTLWKAKE